MTSKPQSVARRVLRDAARAATIHDLRIVTDEEGLAPPDPAGNPAVLTIVYVAVDEQARTATLTVRWCTADGERGDVDLTGTDHVGPRSRADVAEAIRSLLRDAGRTDASYWRIGGERP